MKNWNIWDVIRWGLVGLFAIAFIVYFAFSVLWARWFVFGFGLAFFALLFLEPRSAKKDEEEDEAEADDNKEEDEEDEEEDEDEDDEEEEEEEEEED